MEVRPYLYWSAWAARTKYNHSLGSLNHRNVFSQSSGSRIKVPAGLVFGETLFLDYRRLPYYVLTCSFLCVFIRKERESLGVSSSSYEDQSKLITSFNLNYLCKGLIYRYSRIGDQGHNFGGIQFGPSSHCSSYKIYDVSRTKFHFCRQV